LVTGAETVELLMAKLPGIIGDLDSDTRSSNPFELNFRAQSIVQIHPA
jgi:hypothetical protein